MAPTPTINDYIAQLRLRIDAAQRKFRDGVRALHSKQAADGMLRSGATISKTLQRFETEFSDLTNELIAYLGRAIERTNLDHSDLIATTAQLLHEAFNTFKSVVDREKLLRLVSGGGIATVIDEAFARANQRLTLTLEEFALGLHDAAPRIGNSRQPVPASDRYVTLVDNQRTQVGTELAELKEIVRGDNEVDDDSKQIALSEIAVFEAIIAAPRVATDLVERFVAQVLKWMGVVFGGAVLAEVAQRLVQALLPLIT